MIRQGNHPYSRSLGGNTILLLDFILVLYRPILSIYLRCLQFVEDTERIIQDSFDKTANRKIQVLAQNGLKHFLWRTWTLEPFATLISVWQVSHWLTAALMGEAGEKWACLGEQKILQLGFCSPAKQWLLKERKVEKNGCTCNTLGCKGTFITLFYMTHWMNVDEDCQHQCQGKQFHE